MMSVRRVLVILICAALLLAVDAQCAWACSCAPVASPTSERDEATIVFAGHVVAAPDDTGGGDVSFAVDTVWKGPLPPTVTVKTGSTSGSCGIWFEQGHQYVVYAHASETWLVTGSCDRTKPFARAQEDLDALGAGQPPVANAPLPTQPPTPPVPVTVTLSWLGVASGMILIGALMLGAALRKRRLTAR